MYHPQLIVKAVVAPHKEGIKKVYLADTPERVSYHHAGEARSAAICVALAHATRLVARYEVDTGASGSFDVKVEVEEKE